jgi:hypothetical protein
MQNVAFPRRQRAEFAQGLTSTSSGCQGTSLLTCMLQMTGLTPGTYAANFTTYDGPMNGSIPSGNVLSANQSAPSGFSRATRTPSHRRVRGHRQRGEGRGRTLAVRRRLGLDETPYDFDRADALIYHDNPKALATTSPV